MEKENLKNGVWFFRTMEDFGAEKIPWYLKEKVYNYSLLRSGNNDCYNIPKNSLDVVEGANHKIEKIVMRMPRRNYLGFWKDALEGENINTVLNDLGITREELESNLNNEKLEFLEVSFLENADWIKYVFNKKYGVSNSKTYEFKAGVEFAVEMITDIDLEPGALVFDGETGENWVVK